jgi:hypothetical protein
MKNIIQKHQGFGCRIPQKKELVLVYFLQKGVPQLNASQFWNFMERNEWKTKSGTPIRDWKKVAFTWLCTPK